MRPTTNMSVSMMVVIARKFIIAQVYPALRNNYLIHVQITTTLAMGNVMHKTTISSVHLMEEIVNLLGKKSFIL